MTRVMSRVRVKGLGSRVEGPGMSRVFTAAMRYPVALHVVQGGLFGA